MTAQSKFSELLSTDHLHANLKERSLRGGLLTITSQGTQVLIASVSTVVLARILTPADFGLVAMVTAVTGLGQAFADLGLSEATIQSQDINHNQVSTLFWTNVGIGAVLTILTISLAPVLAWFYKEPRIQETTLILSLTFLIGGLKVQHDAILRRQMRFFALAVRDIASMSLAVLVAILMALKGATYWALVAQPLITNFTQLVLSWLMVRWIPGLPHRDSKVRSMIHFGGNVAASYLVITFNRNAGNALVGWYWGTAPLGLYSRAYNLLMLPVMQLSAPAGRVVIPAFSILQDSPERFARYYIRAIGLIAWISTPVFGFLFVAAKPVIALVLGTRWGEAAPVFQLLAISALGQLLLESTLWLLISRGQSRRLLKLLIFICPASICSFVIGLPFGIKGVALSSSLIFIGMLPWIMSFSFRGTCLTLQGLGRALLHPVLLCLFGISLALVAQNLLKPVGTLTELFVLALGFASAYLFAALIPAVRNEVASFRDLLSAFKPSRQT